MPRSRLNTVVFLGGGRITNALLAGLALSKYRGRLIVHDRNADKLRALRRQFGIATEPVLEKAVEQADLLVIAVRPDSVADLLRHIDPVKRPLIAISLAAGIPLLHLRMTLGSRVHWARAMPSPASRSGRGLAAITYDRKLVSAERQAVRMLFEQVGQVLEVSEGEFDAFTVTYSSSHGYHALAVLAEAAEKLGLKRRNALLAAAHALADGILYWREGSVSLKDLIQEAATPGGIAAQVMHAMDEAGYARLVERGLRAGIARARQNARKAARAGNQRAARESNRPRRSTRYKG